MSSLSYLLFSSQCWKRPTMTSSETWRDGSEKYEYLATEWQQEKHRNSIPICDRVRVVVNGLSHYDLFKRFSRNKRQQNFFLRLPLNATPREYGVKNRLTIPPKLLPPPPPAPPAPPPPVWFIRSNGLSGASSISPAGPPGPPICWFCQGKTIERKHETVRSRIA